MMHLEVGKKYVSQDGFIYSMKFDCCDGMIVGGKVDNGRIRYWTVTGRGDTPEMDIVKEYTEEEWRPFEPEELAYLVGQKVRRGKTGGLIVWYDEKTVKLADGGWCSPKYLLDNYELFDGEWKKCGEKI